MPTEEKKVLKTYSAEFKAETVRLVLEQGVPISQACQDLGVSDTAVRSWIRKHEEQTASRASGRVDSGALSSTERVELARLRKEVQTLKMEREILKKAAAFFAKESW